MVIIMLISHKAKGKDYHGELLPLAFYFFNQRRRYEFTSFKYQHI